MSINLQRIIKYWFQRKTRGWDDSDLWSLDITISEFVLPRLIKYREYCETNGVAPMQLLTEVWLKKLDAMIYSHQQIIREDYFVHTPEDFKKIQYGLNQFAKYYTNLWT